MLCLFEVRNFVVLLMLGLLERVVNPVVMVVGVK
jgi:hypothetical protein